jgi:peptidoglycan/LPS O-acetylase OafA/YrhL
MKKTYNIRRFEALDAFRGLSAVMIVLFHSQFYQSHEPNSFIRNSYIFVDFFFILSGFVMSHAYKQRILSGMGLRQFIVLRLARLYPLHLFTLLMWVPFVGIKYYMYLHGMSQNDPSSINNFRTFLQNLFLLQGFSSTTSWNFPSWSIGVEFYTYLLFYIIIIASFRITAKVRYALYALIALFAYILMTMHQGEAFVLENFLRCVSEFFFGMLIFILYKHYPIRSSRTIVATLLEALILALLFCFITVMQNKNEYVHYVILLFGMLIYLFSSENIGLISKALETRALQHLGKISYSVYMTHALIVLLCYNILIRVGDVDIGKVEGLPKGVVLEYSNFLNMALVLFVIAVSTMTYKYVEHTGQVFMKKRFADNG